MTRQELYQQIQSKGSYLCVGLDADYERIPRHLLKYEDPVYEFNRQVIDATKDLCVAYKPNLAFYEAQGARGWASLQKTLAYIPEEHFAIADAKRGDIGNTSRLYARAFFETMDFDACDNNWLLAVADQRSRFIRRLGHRANVAGRIGHQIRMIYLRHNVDHIARDLDIDRSLEANGCVQHPINLAECAQRIGKFRPGDTYLLEDF